MQYPDIIETIGRSSRGYSLPTKLLQNRIIYLGGAVSPELADSVIMQLMWLSSNDPDKPIDLYINSPGGAVYAGMGIKDVIDTLSCKVNTLGTGMCASMGAYLLACGTGTRKATKNCRIMIHSVSSQSRGTYQDLAVDFKETEFLQTQMLTDMASYSKGKTTFEELEIRTARDCYLSADEATALGIIDSTV